MATEQNLVAESDRIVAGDCVTDNVSRHQEVVAASADAIVEARALLQGAQCAICGGTMVLIRGRYPKEAQREVCPTCLAERVDQIRELSSMGYGAACEAIPLPAPPDAVVDDG